MSHPAVGLDDVVHQRFRLGILAILSGGDRVEFGYIRQMLELSAGNLSRHLTTLVRAQLITVEKGYQGNRARTWVSVTRAGQHAYRNEMSVLRSLLALQDTASTAETRDVGVDAMRQLQTRSDNQDPIDDEPN